jgi:hypothetical protein
MKGLICPQKLYTFYVKFLYGMIVAFLKEKIEGNVVNPLIYRYSAKKITRIASVGCVIS